MTANQALHIEDVSVGATAPKALAQPPLLAAKPKPVAPSRKGIDEEFGF